MENYQDDPLGIYFKKEETAASKEKLLASEEKSKSNEFAEGLTTEDRKLIDMVDNDQLQSLLFHQHCEKYNFDFLVQKPQPIGPEYRLQPSLRRLVVAASLMLCFGAVWWFQAQRPSDWKRLVTARGTVDSLQLPDGTKIWLNAATVLRYPGTFGIGERVVELEKGEAYFEVAKRSATQPFIVLHKDQKTEVLGTRFNIKAYREDTVVTTTLLEGSVSITHGSKKLLLKPGQQVRLDRQGHLSPSTVSLKEATAWRDNYFIFNNKPLSRIMVEVGRWYDMEVFYRDNSLKDELFVINASSRNEPLTRLLEILEASRVVRFEVSDRKIYISRW